jgi:putative protease
VIVKPAEAHRIAPLKPGDGVVFDAADWRSPEEPEEGGRVYQAAPRDGMLELRFGNGVLTPGRIRPGDLVWRTHDPDLDKIVRPFIDAATPVRKQPVRVRVVAREGEPLLTEWCVGELSVRVESEARLGTARNRGLDVEYLTAQLGRLGNTPYELAGVELEVEGSAFAPGSLLNGVRREAVERLQERQGEARPIEIRTAGPRPAQPKEGRARICPTLHLLLRAPEQLDAALALSPASITLDYLDLYGLRPSLDRVRAAGILARVASPRVLKPGEERIVDFLLGCDCPILVRSTGLLSALQDRPHPDLIGDFSLNAANVVTASELLRLGLASLTPTHDLNAAQVSELARQMGGDSLEVVAYQHLPVFHTEHCVFCRFLSAGTSYRDCGRPCEKHQVSLRDSAGRAHPLMADVGCRNTVFGAEAQEASLHLDDWIAAGIHRFRLEFVHETGDQVTRITHAFEDALAGRRSARDLAQQLQRMAPQGATQGSLYVPEGYLTLPVLQ